ncbi:Eukaryotic translation initiation factor 5 [Camellia lanceoleosa]|nr:Eukaryotic translation initiation factor 5 [Camellia lanceoleosa]
MSEQRDEKEHLKEGEAANEKQKKLKKVVKNKGSSHSKNGHSKVNYNKKKANGPDEDQSSPTISQVDKKQEIDNDNDDNMQW